jgi:SAM-dependent methyltransferase
MPQSVLDRMREDWNARAAKDAYYYVAFTRRNQEDAEFFQSADQVLAWLHEEISRLSAPSETCRALEIGCGPGRLMRPLATRFAEIHGVDVSDRMIELARRNLTGIADAHPRTTSGSDLAPFQDEFFDFIYSYAVFQHIPSRNVVMQYLREAVRVLKTGGILTFQVNGLAREAEHATTWEGVSIPAGALLDLARELECQVFALGAPDSRYMWTTWRKRSPFWRASQMRASIREVHSSAGPVSASRGFTVRLTLENLSCDCDLTELDAVAGGVPAAVCNIHPIAADGLTMLTVALPPLPQIAKTSLQLLWRGQPLCEPVEIDVPQPAVNGPVMLSLRDGINYLSDRRIVSRFVKVIVEQVIDQASLRADVDGHPARCSAPVCIDPQTDTYEMNVRLPDTVVAGSHSLELFQGGQALPAERFTVGMLQADDVFRGSPEGAALLEIGADGSCSIGSRMVWADLSRMPFADGRFAGIAHRCARESTDWDELRRVLKADGALYVEFLSAKDIEPERLVPQIAARTGLKFRWQRDLARSMAPRRPARELRGRSLEGYARTLASFAFRAADVCLGTRLARGGMGLYFGTLWNPPDLRPRLNGCVRCGAVHSSTQLLCAGELVPRFPLMFYFCPACGAPNVFTLDRGSEPGPPA